ncbi:DUF2892 domain-containing protein [Celerinatantimonas yamalensis]|uniref:DUF2892 domain-containing protein n=1 Tax=Celerinatantimonas yamalensis TaxID=559956 RepID=A0ABW9G4F4_9GAMM
MQANVGGWDKYLRIVIGVVLIGLMALGYIGLWGWIGVVPILSAAFNYCPLYQLIGFSTHH